MSDEDETTDKDKKFMQEAKRCSKLSPDQQTKVSHWP